MTDRDIQRLTDTERQTSRQTGIHTDTDRSIQRQTDTDRQTDRNRDRQR